MAISSKERFEHDNKWLAINRRLWAFGYWVKWENDHRTMEYRYAIGRYKENKPMGIYENEETAEAMVKMLITNANHEGD